jgi:hypothetical protein
MMRCLGNPFWFGCTYADPHGISEPECHSESLIPSLVHKVWKVFVNSNIVWLFSYRNVIHLMYRSS